MYEITVLEFDDDGFSYTQPGKTLFDDEDFDEGNLREKNQFMFPGDTIKIRFEFSGLYLQAILDCLPTAKVVEKNGNTSIIEAEINYGRGIIIYLLLHGAWVKVLSPQSLADDIREELKKMLSYYEE